VVFHFSSDNWVVYFLIEFEELFFFKDIYSQYKSFISYMVCNLPFHFLNSVEQAFLILNKSNMLFFILGIVLSVCCMRILVCHKTPFK
jgi:hypothetical protein